MDRATSTGELTHESSGWAMFSVRIWIDSGRFFLWSDSNLTHKSDPRNSNVYVIFLASRQREYCNLGMIYIWLLRPIKHTYIY
jgi:hypothetical protein